MPPPLLKVTLAGLLLLGAASFLQIQAANDPSPEELEKYLKEAAAGVAKVKASASKQNIGASTLVVSIDKYISEQIKKEKDAEVRRTLEENHGRLWEGYLKSLGYLSSEETLDRKATPTVKLTPALIEEGTVLSDDGTQFTIKPILEEFYEDYQRDVLLPGALPSAKGIWPFTRVPYKVKLANMEQMTNLLGLLEGTLQLKAQEAEKAAQEAAKAAKRAAAEADPLSYLNEQMRLLHRQMEEFAIEPERYVYFLDDFLPWYRKADPGLYKYSFPDGGKGMKKYWAPFLAFIGAFPQSFVRPKKKAQVLRINWPDVAYETIKSEDLEIAGIRNHDSKEKKYQIYRIAASFVHGYYAAVVENGGRMPKDKVWLIKQKAGYITLAKWALEEWKKGGRKAPKEPFPVKKGLKIAGGLLGAGLAARYGLPPLWKRLFGGGGGANGTEVKPEVEDKPGLPHQELPSPEDKGREPKEREEEDSSDSGLTTILLIVGGLLILVAIIVAAWYCTKSGRSASDGNQDESQHGSQHGSQQGHLPAPSSASFDARSSYTQAHTSPAPFGGAGYAAGAYTSPTPTYGAYNQQLGPGTYDGASASATPTYGVYNQQPGPSPYDQWPSPGDGQTHSQSNLYSGYGIDDRNPRAPSGWQDRRHST